MQVPKRHLPIVGILGLIVIAAAAGGIYYYQFIVSQPKQTYIPVHRLVFINATIVEDSPNAHGFEIKNLAYLNQSFLPSFSNMTGLNMTGLHYTKYQGETDNSTIIAHPGDNITFLIFSKSVSDPAQISGVPGHGFIISPTPDNIIGSLPPGGATLKFGSWYELTATFTKAGTYVYRCTIFCSNGHPNMAGNIIVS